jgi:hypothetical protein
MASEGQGILAHSPPLLGGGHTVLKMLSVVNFCRVVSPSVSFWLPGVTLLGGAASFLTGPVVCVDVLSYPTPDLRDF